MTFLPWVAVWIASAIFLGWVFQTFGLIGSLEDENIKAIEKRQAEIGFDAWEKETQEKLRARHVSDR